MLTMFFELFLEFSETIYYNFRFFLFFACQNIYIYLKNFYSIFIQVIQYLKFRLKFEFKSENV